MNFADVQTLADQIMAAQRANRKRKHAKIYEPRSTTASSIGNKCLRRHVYARTQPHYAAPIGEELSSIFEEGDLHQADVRRELIEIGHEALQAERMFRDEELQIGGAIDGMLQLTPEHRADLIPLEIKGCVGKPPMTAEGLKHGDGRHPIYYDQMQSYLVLTGIPFGIFLFKDKTTGLWWLVPVALDYGHSELLLQRAETVRDHIKAGTLPDRIEARDECRKCPFVDSICLPADAPADPLRLVDDAELLTELQRHEELAPLAQEFARLDKRLKQRFQLTAGDRVIVGDETGFLVQKKPHGKGVRVDIGRMPIVAGK